MDGGLQLTFRMSIKEKHVQGQVVRKLDFRVIQCCKIPYAIVGRKSQSG